VIHDPGTATVTVTDARGAEQRQTVTVQSGMTVQMDFAAPSGPQGTPSVTQPDRVEPPPRARPKTAPPSSVPAYESHSSWAFPAALVSGGVAAAGLGVFIAFGASSQSTFDALNARCGPRSCGPADRAEADLGQRNQTIANVGLGVALVATMATIVFVAVSSRSSDRPPARAFRSVDPGGPGPL
jgi:hypothetical protein